MTEVYRSFEGKLNADCREGYIISDAGELWLVENLSVYTDTPDRKYKLPKSSLTANDFGNAALIAEICTRIDDGAQESGQVFYRGKWYGTQTIREIQAKNQTYNWRALIK